MSSPTKIQDIINTCNGLGAGVIGLSETNYDWKKPHCRAKYEHTIRRHSQVSPILKSWKTTKTVFSTSAITSKTDKQRGGTLTTTTGRWVGRVSSAGSDSRLGRWTWQTLQGDTNLTIITAYRVCQEAGNSGEQTAHAQQHALLLSSTSNPDPRQQILLDLKKFITNRQSKGEAIILLIDGNEDAISPNSDLKRTMDSINMTNLHHLLHGEGCPPTYIRGADQIDHIYGCAKTALCTTHAHVLPFKYGIDTDHRGLYIDLDVNHIFKSTTTQLHSPPPRLLSSRNKANSDNFRHRVLRGCKSHNILYKLQNLMKVPEQAWQDRHTLALNRIDDQFTQIVLHAETKSCHKSYGYPLSDQLIRAGQTLRYWRLRQSATLLPNIDLRRSISDLENRLDIPSSFPNLTPILAAEAVTKARQNLKLVQKDAYLHRQEFLRTQAQAAADDQDISLEKAIQQINTKEQSKRHYQHIKRDLSDTSRSSVTHILIPADGKPPRQSNQWQEIREADKIFEQLLEYSEEHYRLAQPTPFGKSDRATHLGFNGTGIIAHDILDGKYDYDLDELHEEAKLFIQNLRKRPGPQMKTGISPEEVKSLYKTWNECTSTSPSNIHLGIYKALIPSEHLLDILTIKMNLPVKHGITLRRWEHSTMCMIEKDYGSPKLHRLRLIHLFEADLNGIAKILWARRFIHHCQKNKYLHESQHGGLPGSETQHVLLKFRLTIDSAMIMRHNLANTNNDAEACYDRIIPAINGLAHQAYGMPENAIRLQNQLLMNMKYHVRTAHGTSNEHWTNDSADPKFGLGQGGGWSPPGWASLSSVMIESHETISPGGMTLQAIENTHLSTYRTIDAYVDDANNGINDAHLQEEVPYPTLVEDLAVSSQQWERLLNITGGSLNLKKCFWALLTWKFANDFPVPCTIAETPAVLMMENSSTKHSLPIDRLESNEPFKLLGVWVQLAGHMKTHLTYLQDKISTLTRQIRACTLTKHEALMAYKQVAFKRIEYSLPMTTYEQSTVDTLQASLLPSFLASCGYHSKFKRSLVYGPAKYGGMNLSHLTFSRGTSQLRYLISHIRQGDTLGNSMISVLEQLQLLAGTSQSVLTDVSTKLPYLPSCWFTTIRSFLQTINGSIEMPSAWTPGPIRLHDLLLMDIFTSWTKSATKLRRLNACRLWLRVLTISDISQTNGTYLRAHMITGNCNQLPTSYNWPRQQYPSTKCWKLWQKVIKDTLVIPKSKEYELKQPLGHWLKPPTIYYYSVVDPLTNVLYIQNDIATPNIYSKYVPFNSRSTKYHKVNIDTSFLPEITIPVDITEHPGWYIRDHQVQYSPPIHSGRQATFHDHIKHLDEAVYQLLKYTTTTMAHSEIASMISNGTILTIATDGSKKDTGGTFAWIIETHDKTTIAEGMGPVHGHSPTMTSHRTELYGMTSAHEFLFQLCQFYTITTSTTEVHSICDNIECVNKTNTAKCNLCGTSRFLSPDYDIESRLRHIIHRAPFTTSSTWVKGHQDSTSSATSLNHEAQLNIAVDELAEYAYTECEPSKDTIAPFDTTIISLKLGGSRVTSKMKSRIDDSIYLDPLKQYRIRKYDWHQDTWDTIDWAAYDTARKQAGPGIPRFLHRFVNEWLPVGCRTKYYSSDLDERCQSCLRPRAETCEHLFRCSNIRRRHEYRQKVIILCTNLHKNTTYKPLVKSIQTNLLNWSKGEEPFLPPSSGIIANTDALLREAIHEQSLIGWHQFHKGWISIKWAKTQESYLTHLRSQDPTLDSRRKNGITWSNSLIKSLHNLSYETWMFRNKDIHGHTKEEEEAAKLTKLRQKVRKHYNNVTTYPTTIQWRYFTTTIQDKMRDTYKSLDTWITNLQQALQEIEKQDIRISYDG